MEAIDTDRAIVRRLHPWFWVPDPKPRAVYF